VNFRRTHDDVIHNPEETLTGIHARSRATEKIGDLFHLHPSKRANCPKVLGNPVMSTAENVMTNGRLPLKQSGRTVFVTVESIEHLEACGNYVKVRASDGDYLVRDTLSTFADRLAGRDFLRIHRSIVINRNHIRELRRTFAGAYVVTLVSGKEFRVGRSYRQQVAVLRKPV